MIESNGNATPDLFKVTETGFTSIDANSATGGLRVDNAGGGSTAPILELRDNGTTRVKVTRAGRVGIGTTTPDEKFEVEFGNANKDVEIGVGTTDTDVTFITLRSPNGTKFYVTVSDAGILSASTTKP